MRFGSLICPTVHLRFGARIQMMVVTSWHRTHAARYLSAILDVQSLATVAYEVENLPGAAVVAMGVWTLQQAALCVFVRVFDHGMGQLCLSLPPPPPPPHLHHQFSFVANSRPVYNYPWSAPLH